MRLAEAPEIAGLGGRRAACLAMLGCLIADTGLDLKWALDETPDK